MNQTNSKTLKEELSQVVYVLCGLTVILVTIAEQAGYTQYITTETRMYQLFGIAITFFTLSTTITYLNYELKTDSKRVAVFLAFSFTYFLQFLIIVTPKTLQLDYRFILMAIFTTGLLSTLHLWDTIKRIVQAVNNIQTDTS